MKKSKKSLLRNSLLSFVVGDVLGVPFEFYHEGTFKCTGFIGNGTHNQPIGTWSDDTSILLCLIDSLSNNHPLYYQTEIYKENLNKWLFNKEFTCDGQLFDIGYQTKMSILAKFKYKNSNAKGNGALFASLPLALYLLNEPCDLRRRSVCSSYIKVTHNNDECVECGYFLEEYIRDMIFQNILQAPPLPVSFSKQDVTSTFMNVLSLHHQLLKSEKSLMKDLCFVVEKGGDTDTNAALVGGLLGLTKKPDKRSLSKIRQLSYIESKIDKFLEYVNGNAD